MSRSKNDRYLSLQKRYSFFPCYYQDKKTRNLHSWSIAALWWVQMLYTGEFLHFVSSNEFNLWTLYRSSYENVHFYHFQCKNFTLDYESADGSWADHCFFSRYNANATLSLVGKKWRNYYRFGWSHIATRKTLCT